jgi:L-alanine-DL-glutamate epimerase-like enolase superfamily enzyme
MCTGSVFAVTPLFAMTSANKLFGHDKGPVIKKITISKASGSFYRFIGMNSYDKAPKGINGSRRYFTVELSDGSVGIGAVGYAKVDEATISKLKQLIGMDPFTFYHWENDKIIGVTPTMQKIFFHPEFAWIESGILDVIGKLKKQPVWALMGNSVRESVDAYDGTLYFADIANNTDVGIIGEIGKRIKADGYRAIKIKLGRSFKWLPGEAGVNRDIESFIALREAVGQNFTLMADANNGYRNHFDWALKLLKSCAPYNMYFIEELFPDSTDQYIKLREELLKDNFFIPIAEGEDIWELDKFDQYLNDGVYNYIQPDMSTCGLSNILFTARKASKFPHVKLIPHVWQSQLGLIMSLHASKVQHNIPYVEDSRYIEHSIITSGYLFREGQWFLPDKPGWGVELASNYKQFLTEEDIVIS